ncbi:MAG: Coenzyme F420 hydrogenase/dehydrogenase, beta subunit C-terminal domain [Clostridia bacterium]
MAKDVTIAITAASYSGNKGAAAMLQSSIKQLHQRYKGGLNVKIMSVYPKKDREQNPFDFVEIVSCKPEELLFVAFPLAMLYFLFQWIPFVKTLLQKHKIIKAYKQTDMVIDEAGISFVDSRGFVMNTYAFVSMLVPMLLGVPVVKYSQALGEFKNIINKIYAKLLLPHIKLICARGEITRANLEGIGITKNVRLCADGAFSMPDDEAVSEAVNKICEKDSFYNDKVVGISISSVVEKKCNKMGIDYKKITVNFCEDLIKKGYNVLIIANAARMGNTKTRNNDLMICNDVYAEIKPKDNVRWYEEEMTAEKIRELISHCKVLVASRFHAMIGALEKNVPVLLVGWSHKYKEVLDMFELGAYAVDFSKLSLELLNIGFDNVIKNEEEIRALIQKNLPSVLESSKSNIRLISEVIDENLKNNKGLFDFNNTDKYIGEVLECRMGYATDESTRGIAASGGMVTGLLCSLLRNKEIDGAWVTKSLIENGELSYKTFIATTEEEIKDCGSSVYMDIPLLKHFELVKNFDGKIAVVLLPCQMAGFSKLIENNKEIKDKIALKIALYCSGSHDKNATLVPLKKNGISLENANRLIYRRGHWRGLTKVFYNDKTEKSLSYTKNICAYKNAYYFSKERCMKCQNHFAYHSDLSFGDIWLKEMKKNPIKHTSCLIRSEQGKKMYDIAIKENAIKDAYISKRKIVMSQKRALVFKWNLAKAKEKYYQKLGQNIHLNTSSKCKWNHKLAFYLAEKNRVSSAKNPEKIAKLPSFFIYNYMLFIRVLLSF